MYDELVRALRICEDGGHCDLCPKWRDKQNSGVAAPTKRPWVEPVMEIIWEGHDAI